MSTARKSSRPIFISHAATDKAIADQVVDLLDTAMGIAVQDDVFCTSLEGLKIPPGTDFKGFIKDQIQEPEIVILLISQNYLSSQFCLAELGASWAMSHRIIPFLIPPITVDDLKAVLTNIHVLQIDDGSDWNEALAVFRDVLKIDPNINRWERKRDDYLEAIKELIRKQEAPPTVSLAKFQAVKEKAMAANEEIEQLELENAELTEINVRLKRAKDATEVARVELEHLPAAKRFQTLVSEAKREMKPLLSVVREALYYYFRESYLPWGGFGEDAKNADMERAIERELLDDLGPDGARVNSGNPKVARAIGALNHLQKFVDRDAEELVEAYIKEYDDELSFTSRSFWERHLL